ncbi:hypothetical protein RB623_21160 [Mesorhizobium sp. LHD-90]|uniref:hypothetical protein n=1 Tax=Mesorhizobium sp. LHD-90 TaxID=3071414 RepID=UPI0027DF6CB6|nr:hypothetical protein [Mesorhizobium sp. LHD-90]MDQ6436568.1 hypothetical protein [Mesorhizobium sp. LHD-90]
MTTSHTPRLNLEQIVARFPGDGVLIRRLMLKDETFRAICEEYMLARASLSWFEALPDGNNRQEVRDFRTLIPELEVEIEQFLQKSRQPL